MNPREKLRPPAGVVVPVLTVLDENGALIESDQRSLVRYVIQNQRGAHVLFAAGAVGERKRLSVGVWQRLVGVSIEEVAKLNPPLDPERSRPEVWAGITARSRAQTLDNLVYAVRCGADAVVLAPLAVRDLEDLLPFLEHDVAEALEALGSGGPGFSLYLDDEGSAAAAGSQRFRTQIVRAASRLGFVRGIAASGTPRRLAGYAKAASRHREPETFGVYAGEPQQFFESFRERRRFMRPPSVAWTRRHIGASRIAGRAPWQHRIALPRGVVAASANALPVEWARAWQACRVGDAEQIAAYRGLLEMFRMRTYEAGGRRSIACYKRALQVRGIISSAAVAEGTPPLRYPDVERFDRAFEDVRSRAEEALGESFTSQPQ